MYYIDKSDSKNIFKKLTRCLFQVNKCFSFELFIHQRNMKKYHVFHKNSKQQKLYKKK